jgi:hypothetical protein
VSAALTLSIVAIAIAFLSFLWSIGWSIYQHQQTTRGRLYANASTSMIFGPMLPAHPVVDVTVTNAGVLPVTLTSVVGHVKEAPKMQLAFVAAWQFQTPKPLPLKLGPGESWSGHHDPVEVQHGAAKVAPGRTTHTVKFIARDAANRSHEGNSLKL